MPPRFAANTQWDSPMRNDSPPAPCDWGQGGPSGKLKSKRMFGALVGEKEACLGDGMGEGISGSFTNPHPPKIFFTVFQH